MRKQTERLCWLGLAALWFAGIVWGICEMYKERAQVREQIIGQGIISATNDLGTHSASFVDPTNSSNHGVNFTSTAFVESTNAPTENEIGPEPSWFHRGDQYVLLTDYRGHGWVVRPENIVAIGPVGQGSTKGCLISISNGPEIRMEQTLEEVGQVLGIIPSKNIKSGNNRYYKPQ